MDFCKGEVLAFDKPYGWTSFALVAKVRYQLCRRMGIKKLKVGHAGTLDPLATGVLTICTGKATKRIEELQAHTKEYVATLRLGATTPSFDLEKPIDAVGNVVGTNLLAYHSFASLPDCSKYIRKPLSFPKPAT